MRHQRTLVTSVFLSKADALDVLATALNAPWVYEDPTDVTLELEGGVVLSIEVPKFGEDLPLTLDLTHDDDTVVEDVSARVAETLRKTLGWEVDVLALGQ